MNDEMNKENVNKSEVTMESQPNFILRESEVKVETGTYDVNEMREIHNDQANINSNTGMIQQMGASIPPHTMYSENNWTQGNPPQVQNLQIPGQIPFMSQQPNFNQQAAPQFTMGQEEQTKKSKKAKSGKGKRILKKSIALVSAAAVFGVIAGAGFQGVSYLTNRKQKTDQSTVMMQAVDEISPNANNSNSNAQNQTIVQTNSNTPIIATDVSGVVDNVMPAIVAINCTATMTQYDFFNRQYEYEVSGSGSGIIIGQNDDELLIATNNHVVEDATALEIEFVDETKVKATVKGTEPASDLAVVSVKISDISEDTLNQIRVATLGDSDAVKTGEMAIAIGNALGYGQSVTVGYISALDREVTTENTKLKLFQTDAAINPGNSGGALINARGEIIGINSVKYASTDVEGIGYAIPISYAIPIFNELMNREDLSEDEMGYLGIVGKNVEDSYANAFGKPVGIYVYEVAEDSGAEAAGIQKGDIIVGINGKTIETMQDLLNTLSYTRGGTTITVNLKVLENGEYIDKDVEVTLGFRADSN